MENFTYYRPTTPEAAVALLDARWGTAELLGGGTDLLSLQKEYIARPRKVVSLSSLPNSFRAVEFDKNTLTIGGGVKLARLASDNNIKTHATGLAQAADEIAGPQVRNMGTLGGNLCQRNRCWYFRDEHVNCLLKGGDRCFALDGENRYHAVFTQGHKCVIAHPSTLAPALMALGATVQVLGPKGRRSLDVAKLYHAPQGPGDREHVLAADELVLGVVVPCLKDRKSASYEVRQKTSSDWPLVQASVACELVGGKATNVRIALGLVAPVPMLSEAAAKIVEGREITEQIAHNAGEEAAKGARPLSQNGYKVKLLSVAVKRALLVAAGGRRYWEV